MTGQFPPGDNHGHDPHEHHYLVHGPYRVSGHYYGVCKCGTPFRGISRGDIYAAAQLHVDQNQPDGAA